MPGFMKCDECGVWRLPAGSNAVVSASFHLSEEFLPRLGGSKKIKSNCWASILCVCRVVALKLQNSSKWILLQPILYCSWFYASLRWGLVWHLAAHPQLPPPSPPPPTDFYNLSMNTLSSGQVQLYQQSSFISPRTLRSYGGEGTSWRKNMKK